MNKKSIESMDMIKSYGEMIGFIIESNKIEGINRYPTEEECSEYERFMALSEVDIDDMIQFVNVYQPGAILRDRGGLDVRVGSYYPPKGGTRIRANLMSILIAANSGVYDTPFFTHRDYEALHPFTDCNGRSGRMLWKWHMAQLGSKAPLGFLHHWYYQSLDNFHPSK